MTLLEVIQREKKKVAEDFKKVVEQLNQSEAERKVLVSSITCKIIIFSKQESLEKKEEEIRLLKTNIPNKIEELIPQKTEKLESSIKEIIKEIIYVFRT